MNQLETNLCKLSLEIPSFAIWCSKEEVLFIQIIALHKNQHEEKMANDLQYRIDGNFRLIVNKIGISEKAIAFGVELGDQYLPCANAKPHITICTINKGKPVDSNGIATWIPIPEFSIYCHLKVV